MKRSPNSGRRGMPSNIPRCRTKEHGFRDASDITASFPRDPSIRRKRVRSFPRTAFHRYSVGPRIVPSSHPERGMRADTGRSMSHRLRYATSRRFSSWGGLRRSRFLPFREALDGESGNRSLFGGTNARFRSGDANLLPDGIDSLQVGKQDSPPGAVFENDSEFSRVEVFEIRDIFRFRKDMTENRASGALDVDGGKRGSRRAPYGIGNNLATRIQLRKNLRYTPGIAVASLQTDATRRRRR